MNTLTINDGLAYVARAKVFAGTADMKAYVMTTGVIFGVVVIAHIWRMLSENAQLATDPAYLAITITAGALCLWAVSLIMRSPRA